MSSKVRQFVSKRLVELEELELSSRPEARITVCIDYYSNRAVEYVAKKLELSKSAFCAEVINASLGDLQDELGLSLTDVHSEYYKYVFGDQGVNHV